MNNMERWNCSLKGRNRPRAPDRGSMPLIFTNLIKSKKVPRQVLRLPRSSPNWNTNHFPILSWGVQSAPGHCTTKDASVLIFVNVFDGIDGYVRIKIVSLDILRAMPFGWILEFSR